MFLREGFDCERKRHFRSVAVRDCGSRCIDAVHGRVVVIVPMLCVGMQTGTLRVPLPKRTQSVH